MKITDLLESVSLGIALGLFTGKQIGVFGAGWVLLKLSAVKPPSGVRTMHFYGVSQKNRYTPRN